MKFVFFLVAVIMVGLLVGGAYAAGIAMGKREVSAAAPAAAASTATRAASTPQAGQGESTSPAGPRASGQQGGQSAEGTGGMAGGRPAVSGTVQGIEGNTITIATQQGTAKVTVKDDTPIQKMATVGLEELQEGERVMIVGERSPDGTYVATSVQIVPAGRASSP